MAKFIEIEAKSILTKHKFRDDWFWDRYAINSYRGCQFACNYCDAITEKYLVHEDYKDFSSIIYVKRNAPELLEREVKKVKPDVVAMSGVTDPYQPAEKKYELTRIRFLELLKKNFPELVEKYESLYSEQESPQKDYIARLNRCAFEFCKKYRIKNYILPPSFERSLKENFEVANLLLLIAFFKEFKSANPYSAWAYHKVSQNIENLNESIKDVCKRGELRKISGVGESIIRVIEDFLVNGKSERLEKEMSPW